MAGMWELPTRERELRRDAGKPAVKRRLWPGEWSIDGLSKGHRIDRVRHSITRHRIMAEVFKADEPAEHVASRADAGSPETMLVTLEEAGDRALTGMTRKILARKNVRALFARPRSAGATP